MLLVPEPSTSSSSAISRAGCSERRRRRRPQRYTISPSSTVLSLLATVVGSSSASASPIALKFLCPGVEDERTGDFPSKRAVNEPSNTVKRKRRVPDRFTPGPDGVWRKASWTLYGHTMCADCGYMPTTTSATLPTAGADDTVDPSPTSDESASQSAFIASLPPGWKLELSQEKHATVIVILTVSLSLAFTICFVIICSVIWRKRTKRTRDVEKRPPKGTVGDNVHAVVEKEIKMKQKVLAKATARWKANARYTFRQRRGKRRTIQQHSDSELDLSPTLPSVIETPASERSSLSLVCSEPVVHDDAPLDAADERECTADERPPPPLQLSSPPAYPIQSIDHTLLHPGSYHPRSTPSSPSSNLQSRRTSVSSLTSEMCSEHQSLTYRPHLMAHLATDDKTVLEQLNQLSSAPEGSGILSSSVFAPVWRDEELSDFVHRRDPTSTVGTSDSHSDPYSQSSNFDAMPFPSPPTSKGKELDHYSYSYHSDRPYGSLYEYDQGFLDVEPDAGPSAPPFEPSAPDEGPSAPPFEPQNTISHSHQPSAPFLLTDETNSTHSQEDSLTEPVCTLDLVHTGEESQAHDHEMMP